VNISNYAIRVDAMKQVNDQQLLRTGAGYAYTDPTSGAGGYIIDGGSNGGALEFIGNLQKYLFTPHITGFGTGARLKHLPKISETLRRFLVLL
jgi:hypothetical protein